MSSDPGEGYFRRAINGQWAAIGRLMLSRRLPGMLPGTPVNPVYSSIMLTQNCNYKCMMCSFWHQKSEGELTLEEIDRVAGEIRQLGIAQLNFTGGEPFLRKDFADIVRAVKGKGFKVVQVTTNGSLTTEKRLRQAFDAGLDRVAMSLDGVGEHHESQRGVPGAWKKALRTLDALRDLRAGPYPHIEVELAMLMTKLNQHDLDDVLALCREYHAVLHLQFLDNVQFFTAGVDFDENALSAEEVDALIDRVHWHIDNSPGMDPLLTHQGMEYIRRYMKGEDPSRDMARVKCGVGYALLYIDAHGQVYPGCWSMPPLGNVRETSLLDLVDSPKHRRVAQDCFNLDCPGCPNGYAWNVFTSPRAIAREVRTRVARKVLPSGEDV